MNSQATLSAVTGILTHYTTLLNGDFTMDSADKKSCPVINTPSNDSVKTETAPAKYNKGAQFTNVDEAFADVLDRLSNPARNDYNEALDFTYANLPQILDMLRPILGANGCYMTQVWERNEANALVMATTFCHALSRTEKVFKTEMTVKTDRRLDDCQQMGAAITYYRRYALLSIFGMSADVDDADQSEARKQRRKEKREAETNIKERVWAPAVSERTKEESILNVLVAAGRVKDPEFITKAKARNCALVTPAEEEFIQDVEKDHFNAVYLKMLTLMPKIAAQRASGEFPDYGDQIWRYRQLWLEACKATYTESMLTACGADEPTPAALIEKRDKYREKLQNGEITTHSEDDALLDQIVEEIRSGNAPLPPHDEEAKLPAVDLECEHTVLMRQKFILSQEIADGDGSVDDKVRLIKQVMSRADFHSAKEINQIIARLTNSGAPFLPEEDDLPY